ncbi:hypothetical protein KEM52_001968, partial [Ascosphaera acerosa]
PDSDDSDVEIAGAISGGDEHSGAAAPRQLKMPAHRSAVKRASTLTALDWSDDDDDDEIAAARILLKRRRTETIPTMSLREVPGGDASLREPLLIDDSAGNARNRHPSGPNHEYELKGQQSSSPLSSGLSTAPTDHELDAVLVESNSEQQPAALHAPPPAPRDSAAAAEATPGNAVRVHALHDPTVSQASTELMSSETYAVARRAAATDLATGESQRSIDSTDELALPVTVSSASASRERISPLTEKTVSFAEQPCAAPMLGSDLIPVEAEAGTADGDGIDSRITGASNDVGASSTNGYASGGPSVVTPTITIGDDATAHTSASFATTRTSEQEQSATAGLATGSADDSLMEQYEQLAQQMIARVDQPCHQDPAEPTHTSQGGGTSLLTDTTEPVRERAMKTPKSSRRASPQVRITTSRETHAEDDDDELAGLPREMYRPRPSRSRSKTFEDYIGVDTTDAAAVPDDIAQSVSALAETEPSIDSRDKPTTKKRTKPAAASSKKKKVKRGKTASAAVLRRRATAVETDVIWIDDDDDESTLHEQPNADAVAKRDRERTPIRTIADEAGQQLPSPNFAVLITTPKKDRAMPPAAAGDSPVKSKAESHSTHIVERDEDKASNGSRDETKLEPARKASAKRKRTKSTAKPAADGEADQASVTERAALAPTPAPAPDTVEASPAREPRRIPAPADEVHVDGNDRRADVAAEATTTPEPAGTEKAEQPTATTPAQLAPAAPTSEPPQEPRLAMTVGKGPAKHSPIPLNKRAHYRVGLSRKVRVAPLLKVIRK